MRNFRSIISDVESKGSVSASLGFLKTAPIHFVPVCEAVSIIACVPLTCVEPNV